MPPGVVTEGQPPEQGPPVGRSADGRPILTSGTALPVTSSFRRHPGERVHGVGLAFPLQPAAQAGPASPLCTVDTIRSGTGLRTRSQAQASLCPLHSPSQAEPLEPLQALAIATLIRTWEKMAGEDTAQHGCRETARGVCARGKPAHQYECSSE